MRRKGKNKGGSGRQRGRRSTDQKRIAALNRRQQTSRYIAQAQAAWNNSQYEKAIDLYKKALKGDPNNAALVVDLARAYGRTHDYAAVERLLDQTIRWNPDSPEPYHMAGRTYELLGLVPDALSCYRQAVQLEPDSCEAQVALARMLERLHQLDDARIAIDRALSLDPSAEEALLGQAKLDRRAGELARAESRLRQLLDGESVTEFTQTWASYELGQVLDALGNYDGAMQALRKAKALLKQDATDVLDKARFYEEKIQQTLETVTPEHFERWHDAMLEQPPHRLATLAGHPRTGTTLLEQVLDAHPQLISAEETIVMTDYVCIPLANRLPPAMPTPRMLDMVSAEDVQQVRKSYIEHTEAILGEPIGARILLDKNPTSTLIIPQMNRVFPEMKVIIAIRDPRDVCLSCFMQSLPVTIANSYWLSLAQTVAYYSMIMSTWLKIRPMIRTPWIEIRYELAVADLESQARRLVEFLELPWNASVLGFRERSRKKHIRTPSYEAVTEPVHTRSIGRWKNYAKYLEPHLDKLEPFIKEFNYS